MPETPTYYANWELVGERVMYETRKRTMGSVGAINIVLHSYRQVRPVITKTYEATLQDADPSAAELPCPAYLAGTSTINANPEGLSPVGWDAGQWHQSDMQYDKSIGAPMSRRVRVTWEHYGAWVTIEDDSDSQ